MGLRVFKEREDIDLKNKIQDMQQDVLKPDYTYVCSEIRLARYLGIEPDTSSEIKDYDFWWRGYSGDVKSTKKGFSLNVRKNKELKPCDIYVGVHVVSPCKYVLMGWYWGDDLLRDENLLPAKIAGNDPYYSILRSKLLPIEYLWDLGFFENNA